MTVKSYLENLDYEIIAGDENKLLKEVGEIVFDHRKVTNECVFVCIKGAKFDAHTHIVEILKQDAAVIIIERAMLHLVTLPMTKQEKTLIIAVEDTRYAKAVLLSKYYDEPSKQMRVIGVTGSKGKTTVTHMLSAIFEKAGYKPGTIGSNGAMYDNKLIELNNSTPDSEDIQKYLYLMKQSGCDVVIIECSSQGLMQSRVAGVDFDYGIFTNISPGDHIGPTEHRDFNHYLACKEILLQQARCACINKDDEHADSIISHLCGGHTLTFSCEKDSDYQAISLHDDFADNLPLIRFSVNEKNKTRMADVAINMPAKINVYNALAAICVAREMNISYEDINEALLHLHIKGRFDIIYRDDHFTVCVDFAHNGYSTRNHLKALRKYKPKRIVCIFGADGGRDINRRIEMGEASGRYADFSIITAGHNRLESFENICKSILEGMHRTEGVYTIIPNRKDAIRYALSNVQEGDLITILGIGHENFQDEGGIKYEYNDEVFAKQVICEIKGSEKTM